jgi:hypothetical protein
MSSCAPIGQSDNSDLPSSAHWLFLSSTLAGSWASSTSLTVAVKDRLADDESPLHPGLSGVVAIFDKDVEL